MRAAASQGEWDEEEEKKMRGSGFASVSASKSSHRLSWLWKHLLTWAGHFHERSKQNHA